MASSLHQEALQTCLALAREASEAGDSPFGSCLVDAQGTIIKTDRNRTRTGLDGTGAHPDSTLHPEFTLAQWAMLNLTAEERASTTCYTSGEHCPMCSAAHAWCGLGDIVFIASAKQYDEWLRLAGFPLGPVKPLGIGEITTRIKWHGPVDSLVGEIKAIHEARWAKQGAP